MADFNRSILPQPALRPQSGLERFVLAQRDLYPVALAEIRASRKRTHWMWFIFPQLAGLGSSEMARYYGLQGRDEAVGYLGHPVLGPRLVEASAALLDLGGPSAHDKPDIRDIFGTPDDLKLRSCCTLFSLLSPRPSVFEEVLSRYFAGQPDQLTLQLLD